jgi:hypothetical protein
MRHFPLPPCYDTLRENQREPPRSNAALVMPQNRHLADYSNQATIYMMSLWKRTTKRLVHVVACTRCGWIQVATVTQVHDGTHKRIYNITTKTPRVKISKYTIQRSKSYIKKNSIRVRTRIQMGLRGQKINDGVHNPAQAKPKG